MTAHSPEGKVWTAASVYRRYAAFVRAALRRCGVPASDLGDAGQDVFLAVHRGLGAFAGRSSLENWLFGICRHVASNRRRQARLRHEVSLAVPVEDIIDDRTEEAMAETGLRCRAAVRALEALPADQLRVLTLFAFENRGCKEISRALGIPLGTVYSRLRLARHRLDRYGTSGAAQHVRRNDSA